MSSKCPEGMEPNPNRKKRTRRCRVICKENKYRDENFNCVAKPKKTRKSKSTPDLTEKSISNEIQEALQQPVQDPVSSIGAVKSIINSHISPKISSPSSSLNTKSYTTKYDLAKSTDKIDKSCDEHKQLLEQRKILNANVSKKNAACEEYKFKEILQYFDYIDNGKKHTHRDLLIALQKLYIDIKNKDAGSTLTFNSFIQMFPRDTMTNIKFKRQHVFEAICRLILLYNFDDGELGRDKRFYKKLEDIVNNNDLQPDLTKDEILEAKINESSKGGVADIVFQTEYSESAKSSKDEWMCDCSPDKSHSFKKDKKLVFISNKYFDVEKTGNKDEYDVNKIFGVASKLKMIEGIETKIVLMVNNKQSLDNKLSERGVQANTIYGSVEMEEWFRKLIVDLREHKTIDVFLQKYGSKTKTKPELKPRFHQSYFTDTTLAYNNNGTKMFIWGAVPRSGKSYMIGDLISNRSRREPGEQDNDIVIILGAKTETEGQFKQMFDGFSNFDEYGVILASDKQKSVHDKTKAKNIYIFSQQWFKNGKIIDHTFVYDKVVDRFKDLFHKKKIDLYFDEIHKGGTTDNSNSILLAFNNADVKIDLFVMVTATFAKPSIRYNTGFIDIKDKKTKIIEWSYEDQQNMKQLKDETKRDMMCNSRKDAIEKRVITDIFDKYNEDYGAGNYLDIISNQYANNPELVLLQPDTLTPFNLSDESKRQNIDIPSVFIKNLRCDACASSQSITQLTDPIKIFEDPASVRDLIRYIGNIDDENPNIVDSKCVYSHLQRIGAPTNGVSPHSELWFLPDKNLYLNPSLCKGACKSVSKEENQDEDDDAKTGLPNIEPLTRGLALLLMENSYFKKRYNVLIVQGTDMTYKRPDGTKITFKDIGFHKDSNIHTINEATEIGLSEIIKSYEKFTFEKDKSLIILTGAKMRLGISLPCVDVAFNFDTVSAVDNNYQTMFRVLTERVNRPKKYGFYVDMNKSRAIEFLYDYNQNYGSGKNERDQKKRVEILQSLMFMFNYNGLGLNKLNEMKELKLYDSLIKELKLDENSYNVYNSKLTTMKSLIKTGIGNIDLKLLKEFKMIVGKKQPPAIKHTLKKNNNDKMPTGKDDNHEEDGEHDDDGNEEDGEHGDDEDDNDTTDLINILAEYMPSIIAMLALFSNENDYNCDSIDKCIFNAQTNMDSLVELCSCDKKTSTIACYMNQSDPNRYNKDQLYKLLNICKLIIENIESEQLSINLNIIFFNIRESMGKNNDAFIWTMSPEDIQTKITEYLPVRDEEKDKFGEVFTPAALINEMMDRLPPSVWKDPTLKWLDPANGIGNFPMIVYKRLMDKLPAKYNKDSINYDTESGKSKHILKNMLYMCEINKNNVNISRRIFGPNANICCCDFLNEEEKWKKQFGVDTFDIIMGNPPFQKEQEGKREGAKGGRTLWDKFIIKSLELLIANGFLGFITPPPWRKPENELYNVMTKENQLLYLHIYNKKHGQELFGVSSRIDLYVIEKKPKYKNTIIIDELEVEHNFDLSKWSFLPNYAYDSIKSIMTDKKNGIDVNYSSTIYETRKPYVKQTKSVEKYKYPIVHSINQTGLVFWYTDDKTKRDDKTQKAHFGVPKVLLNFNEQQYPVNDYEGKYGMSQITFGIPITSKKQGDDIVKAINTDEFKEIIKATKWSAFNTDWRMFKYFKPDFYKQFLGKKTAAATIKRAIRNHIHTKKQKKAVTKIQAVVRGKQTRNKQKKGGAKTKKRRWSLF